LLSAFGSSVIDNETVSQLFDIFIQRIGNFTITLSHEVNHVSEDIFVKSTVHVSTHALDNLTHEYQKNVSKSELHCVIQTASSSYLTKNCAGSETSCRTIVYVLYAETTTSTSSIFEIVSSQLSATAKAT
jgi:hypothetical protein